MTSAPLQQHVADGVGPRAPDRVGSIDAYRGFVMFLMMAEVLHLGRVAQALPESGFWRLLAYHQTHVEWRGCSLHDLIQPSFTFLVGVALPFSLASRARRGEPLGRSLLHAAWRSLMLVALGVLLRSVGRPSTNYTFEDTLTQIGLGYFPLFVIGLGPPRLRWLALAVILVGYWAAFAWCPLPGPDFDYAQAGVPADWPHHASGFAAHWNKNTNLAWAFDRWFLNLFSREQPFTSNGGGYATLSFIPTLGTMLLGLIAGGWLRQNVSAWAKPASLLAAAVVALAIGYAADWSGVCPSVKRIWTPSWVLVSGGWCFLLLAAFYVAIDLPARWGGWAYPLRVIGANSIAAYCMAHLIGDFVVGSFRTHLGPDVFGRWGAAYAPLIGGAAVLTVYWLILWWMYRRRIFVRI
jgi:heparan-alpha-glucosaminide N-acetyltransferase